MTQDKLKKLLSYDPQTGVFIWLNPLSSRAKRGSEAGVVQRQKGRKSECVHRYIGVSGRRYAASHLAYLYMTGNLPGGIIDHIDGNGLNNSWANLRIATNQQNQFNRKTPRGYSWHKGAGKWRATIFLDRKQIHLGFFTEESDARAAYLAACEKYHGTEWMQRKTA